MKLLLSLVSPRRSGITAPAAELLRVHLDRAARYLPTDFRVFPTEAALLAFLDDTSARTRPILLAADSRGQQISSPELAGLVGGYQDGGAQLVVLAIGPADGWSPVALKRADRTLAFGRITLPHELAAIVAAEQLYRALTIRAGHPYHSGH
jgi:23S rRNA (pseudouridine1915-N3)-methyltransferase